MNLLGVECKEHADRAEQVCSCVGAMWHGALSICSLYVCSIQRIFRVI